MGRAKAHGTLAWAIHGTVGTMRTTGIMEGMGAMGAMGTGPWNSLPLHVQKQLEPRMDMLAEKLKLALVADQGGQTGPAPRPSVQWVLTAPFCAAMKSKYLAVTHLSNSENTMAVSPSIDAVAGRASLPRTASIDVHAGHSPRSGGPRGLPPGTLGLRVVHFILWSN